MGEEAELRQPEPPPCGHEGNGGGGVNWGEVIKGGGRGDQSKGNHGLPPIDVKVMGGVNWGDLIKGGWLGGEKGGIGGGNSGVNWGWLIKESGDWDGGGSGAEATTASPWGHEGNGGGRC